MALLILSRILQPNASTSLYLVFATQLVFSLNLRIFLKNHLFSFRGVFFVVHSSYKIINVFERIISFSNFHLGINFVPSDKTRMVDILGLKLFGSVDRSVSPYSRTN